MFPVVAERLQLPGDAPAKDQVIGCQNIYIYVYIYRYGRLSEYKLQHYILQLPGDAPAKDQVIGCQNMYRI